MSLKALKIVSEEFKKGHPKLDPSHLVRLEGRILRRIERECGTTPYESERIRIQEISRCHDCTSGYRCEKHA